MGNRHGGEKASKEEKEEKRKKKKEKKAKKKGRKKTAAGSDVDLDLESSQFSRADSESMVFHSAENLSPYLDASTRSEEGAACVDFYDHGHILSSKDFHDGFSIEACLPAELAASGMMADVSADVKPGDDVASMASGCYSTPLLSSPDVRRGIPRSPMAQRHKDSFLEPVPPIPSNFSSNTLSSVSYQEGVSTPGTERSSSRASSSTVDTNAAHCIERLEELERNIERTIIEKFAPIEHADAAREGGTSSETSTPMLKRRQDVWEREGSVTPRGVDSDGALCQSPEHSPAVVRKISEPCRPLHREGSATPKGIIHGMWSQSAENSPVIVRKALPSPESPVILRRTPSQSPTVERKFPVNAPESPRLLRRGPDSKDSPRLSPNVVRRAPIAAQEKSPQLVRKLPPAVEALGSGALPKAKVPPPVPPKPPKTLASPEIARRIQNMPKSPIMPRKVYAFQDAQAKDSRHPFSERGDNVDRSWRENQMPPRSPSRSPEVRHRVARKTPSSSPSPKSLGRKLIPQEDRAPPSIPLSTSPPNQIQFCQQERGIPVKHCIVATQPSTAVMLATAASQESLGSSEPTPKTAETLSRTDTQPLNSAPESQKSESRKPATEVSEDSIKQSTESAVFGSVSPKLKRHKNMSSPDDYQSKSDAELQRADSFGSYSGTRSTPCSPQGLRSRRLQTGAGAVLSESSDLSEGGLSDSKHQSPATRRAHLLKQNSKCKDDTGTLSADIAGGLTYHTHFSPEGGEGTGYDPAPGMSPGHVPDSPHPPCTERVSPVKKLTPTSASRVTEGPIVSYHCAAAAANTRTQVSHTATHTPPSKQATRGAVIADSTVIKNAAAEGTGAGGQGVRGEASFTDTAGTYENVRVYEGECERVPGASRRVPSPPSLPDTAEQCSGGRAISRTLGQRIRDVINESTFREVFTAELSSSSVEKDDVASCTSDDSVFTHGSHQGESQHHRYFRKPADDTSSVDTHLSDSPLSSPLGKRSKLVTRQCVDKVSSEAQTPTQPSRPVDISGAEVSPHQAPVSVSLDTTAIRRIDVDVNVTLLAHQRESDQHLPSATTTTTATTTTAPSTTSPSLPAGSQGHEGVRGGQQAGVMDSRAGDGHSLPPPQPPPSCSAERNPPLAKTDSANNQPCCVTGTGEGSQHAVPETKRIRDDELQTAGEVQKAESATERGKGDKRGMETLSTNTTPSPALHSTPAHVLQTSPTDVNAKGGEKSVEGEVKTDTGVGKSCPSLAPIVSEELQGVSGDNIHSPQPAASPALTSSHSNPVFSTPQSGAGRQNQTWQTTHSAETTRQNLAKETYIDSQQHETTNSQQHETTNPQQHETTNSQQHETTNSQQHDTTNPQQHETTNSQQHETTCQENVPPPSPTAMDALAEEEEEEEDVEGLVNAHQDSDISTRISQEMQLFGETVVKRLSSLLESQASESDSCLEESRTDLLRKPSTNTDPVTSLDKDSQHLGPPEQHPSAAASGKTVSDRTGSSAHTDSSSIVRGDLNKDVCSGEADRDKEESEPVLHEELNTFSASDLPGERLVTSDTTETLSTDHETSASSKRESTTSTATDETLTSFKTRSTDSAEFDEAFVLPESLVFVRSVNEGEEGGEDGGGMDPGRIVRRPPIPAELTRHASTPETPHKPRKKRRRQVGSYDVSARSDVTEPEPKRGSKQIRDVIDAYCDEVSEDSDLSSSTDDILRDEIVHRSTYSRNEQQPSLPPSMELQDGVRDIVRKPKPPADRSTDSSDESPELDSQRRSSSSHDSSFRIPEIEETFGELMGVKTFLEDLEDKTPTSEPLPLLVGAEELRSKELLSSGQYRRRSKTSPARTDRTESDLDVSEHRDDASTDSMYADDEDEGTELVFQRSYSEEHGGEVVLSCTIYNSAHDNDGDSDVFWADAEAAAAEENYKVIETAADAAGSAFQNARIQMHDIHQHLQDLRRQMELLQDDITSTSLTLTPDYSLESEHRPVTE